MTFQLVQRWQTTQTGVYDVRTRTFDGASGGTDIHIPAGTMNSVEAFAGHSVTPKPLSIDMAAFKKWVGMASRQTHDGHTANPGRQFVLSYENRHRDAYSRSVVGVAGQQAVSIPADSQLFVSTSHPTKIWLGVGQIDSAVALLAFLCERTSFLEGRLGR